MFGWLGRFVVRRAWWVIGGWLLAALASSSPTPSLADITSADQGSFLPHSYESVQAIELAERAFPQQATATAIIVVKRADGQPLTPADEARVGQLAQALQAKNIARTSGYLTGPQAVAPDKSIQVVNVGLDAVTPDDPALLDAVRELRTALGPELAGSGLTAGVAGDVASFVDNEDTFTSAFAIVGMATIVLIIGLILLIFRSPIAALLPVVVIGIVLCRDDRPRRGGGQGVRSQRQPGPADDPADRAVRHRHRLHPVPAVPLPGAAARRRRQAHRDGRLRGAGRRGHRVGGRSGHRRVPRAAARVAGLLRLARPGAGDRRRRHADHLADAHPGDRVAARPVRLLAVQVVAAPPEGHRWRTGSAPPSGAGRRWSRRHPAPCWSRSPRAVSGYKADYDFSAGFPQDTESAKAAADLQRGFAAGALAPTEVYLDHQRRVAADRAADQRRSPRPRRARPGSARRSRRERGTDPSVARINLLLDREPGLQRGDHARPRAICATPCTRPRRRARGRWSAGRPRSSRTSTRRTTGTCR